MAVSAVGQNTSFDLVRRLGFGVVLAFLVLGYLWGPPAAPAMRDAAVTECNEHAEGDFRSFRLTWEVGLLPHWSCWDSRRPERDAVSLGWGTNPFD